MTSLRAASGSHASTVPTVCNLPIGDGILEMRVYPGSAGREESIAMVARVKHGQYSRAGVTAPRAAELGSKQAVVMRVHDQCQTSEVFGSVKCDCKQQLDKALSVAVARARRAWHEMHAGAAEARDIESSSDGAASAGSAADEGSVDSDASPDLDPDAIVAAVLYLKQEGRGIGLAAKVAAYALQEREDGEFAGYARSHPLPHAEGSVGDADGTGAGLDTVDANRKLGLPDDSRDYRVVTDILRDLGLLSQETAGNTAGEGAASGAGAMPSVHDIKAVTAPARTLVLMTNNPRKREELRRLGVPLAEELMPCVVDPPSPLAAAYMRTKAERMGHSLEGQAPSAPALSAPSI